MNDNNLKKNLIWNAIGPITYALHSLVFLVVVTRINGVDVAGVFSFAFSFACLLICIGNYATRAFQVTESDKFLNDYDFIYHRVITCSIMIAVGIVYGIIIGSDLYSLITIILLILYKVMESLSEVIYAIIQKNNDLYKVGISFFVKGLAGMLVFLIIDIWLGEMLLAVLGLITVIVVIFLGYDLRVLKKYKIESSGFDLKNVKKIFATGFHPFLFTFLSIYVINASRFVINRILESSEQTIFGILIMPMTLFSLASQFLIHPFLMKMKLSFEQKEKHRFISLVTMISSILIGVGIIGGVFAWVLGIPFFEIIYGLQLDEYKLELVLVVVGATIFALTYVLSTALITMRHTKVQTIVFTSAAIVATVFAEWMTATWNVSGAVYAYTSSMVVLLLLYLIAFIRSVKKEFHK